MSVFTPKHLRKKYVLKAQDRTLIAVEKSVCEMLCEYAQEKRLTMVEATYRIILAGLQRMGWLK